MLRIPVRRRTIPQKYSWTRLHSSSSFIRSTFIDYFKGNGHKVVRSSSVVPLCDPTVPFVNAGMNQFKGVFLGNVQPPCLRAVNSQKCVRVGGKHNDLDVVGTDGHHHTFFEMMGNWSFGDYYKKEACQMAWDLLLGPYQLKPEQLVVTYFAGDPIIGLVEDRECRDIWKAIGVPSDRLRALDAKDNFWEMGATGPCGPCTEIHYVNPDGSLTEIWNLVFIQCNRESDGKVTGLRTHHVDTGMGLERITALLQGVSSNYDTDLFLPIIRAIEQKSKGVQTYGGRFGNDAVVDSAYRRLADHSRMISVCLADGVFPATSLNLKQILRKSFKISSDMFQCKSGMLSHLYDIVSESLSSTYPELLAKRKEAQLILQYEEESYAKLRSSMAKKWRDLSKAYPEIEQLSDVELAGFASGYKEFKETMAKQNATVIPGELVFKLYDTHGFQEDVINRIAELNNLEIDKKTFWKLLSQHKSRHKTAFKEQTDKKGIQFDQAIEKLIENGVKRTNDQYKYDYTLKGNKLTFEPLKTSLVAILNEDGEGLDFSEPSENKPYYLVTKDTNFYCEEGGQTADIGSIEINKDLKLNVESVFKIRDFIFHKGYFKNDSSDSSYVSVNSDVVLNVNSEKRLKTMRNHTATHLLNAAMRKVLPNSVVCQIGSNVTDKGLVLNLSVYGDKLSQKVVNDAQNLVRNTIQLNAPIATSTLDSVQLSMESSVLTVPGETYPEVGLRLVTVQADGLISKELCCGTHLPSTGLVGEFCVTLVKGAGSHTPALHAITGDAALEARELYCRAQKLQQVIALIDPERMKQEAGDIKRELTSLCGTAGTPHSEYAECLALLDTLMKQTKKIDCSLETIALAEVRELADQVTSQGRQFLVHFLRCSYLMQRAPVKTALTAAATTPAMLLACANGTIHVACSIPENMVTSQFTAERWLRCVLPVFEATMLAPQPGESTATVAEMTGTKVSLITCEQLVQDAMRAAIKFAEAHTTKQQDKMRGLEVKSEGDDSDGHQDRRTN